MVIQRALPWQPFLVASALVFGVVATHGEPQHVSPSVITQVEVDRASPNTVVRVMGSGPLACHVTRLSGPERLVLDFPGAHLARLLSSIPAPFPPLVEVRTGQFRPGVARVVIDLEQAVAYHVLPEENSVTVEFDVVASARVGDAPAPAAQPGQALRPARALSAETSAPALRPLVDTNSTLRSGSSAQPASPSSGGPPPENEAAPFEGSFKDGMLTFRAQNQNLRTVLKRIGDQAGVSIYLAEGLANDQISVEFQHYRLDEALRQILSRYDVFFLYGEGQGALGSATLRAVWVYPTGRAEERRPLPSQCFPASTRGPGWVSDGPPFLLCGRAAAPQAARSATPN
jgi:hypothetical protein